jgi:hypothetical protein
MTRPVGLLLGTSALAACLSAPAHASENRAEELARRLDDPDTQYRVAGALSAITSEFLEMRAEPFLRAMEAAGAGEAAPDLPPDATLGDLAGPEAQRLPGEIERRVPDLMGSLAEMASAFGAMQPELEAMARRMKDAVPQP